MLGRGWKSVKNGKDITKKGWEHLASMNYTAYVSTGKVSVITAIIIKIPISDPQEVIDKELIKETKKKEDKHD